MKLPRGFGKNYFSLQAITATVNHVSLSCQMVRVNQMHTQRALYPHEEDEQEALCELDPPTLLLMQQAQKGCHCSVVFFSKTRKILALFFMPKRQKSFYHTLNNAISPP